MINELLRICPVANVLCLFIQYVRWGTPPSRPGEEEVVRAPCESSLASPSLSFLLVRGYPHASLLGWPGALNDIIICKAPETVPGPQETLLLTLCRHCQTGVASGSPGGLRCTPPLERSFSRSGTGPKNLHFLPVTMVLTLLIGGPPLGEPLGSWGDPPVREPDLSLTWLRDCRDLVWLFAFQLPWHPLLGVPLA